MKEERIIIIDEGADEVNPDGFQACCWGPPVCLQRLIVILYVLGNLFFNQGGTL